ncbi:N-acetylglucosamine-6-phosphate deacetylase [Plantibacter sp. H53]|uniref:N-acetylglucosamine-6-phosphate deacetylase n=1 Tax=Plantibacter sp. H53 TaxID=1827323 RepID=UPI0007D9D64C|nr:N-acetylglucosamine-6-phosphate deacetylase [Plantibacter sp. H53]OAN27588.1 N-acetylglucosamine-6-phosphate deacetylase [Plantibacter sp. H53]
MTELLIHSATKVDVDGHQDAFWLHAVDGVIRSTGTGDDWRSLTVGDDASVLDAHGGHLTPGFIDLHVHGGGGSSFDDGRDAIGRALAVHRAHGTTRTLISLVSNPVDALVASLEGIADLVAEDPLVLGAHLEGPFLSSAKKGAHDPGALIDPSPAVVERLIDASRGTLRQITIAPELPNALEAIQVLVEAGVIVAVGHTDADEALTKTAFDLGARLVTHVFNAMNGIHHRAPGPIIASFADERVTVELILDGEHVHPDVAKLAFEQAPGRVALITDAMAAAGSSDGRYLLGALEVQVTDGLARLVEGDSIAGSTLTLDRALRLAITSGVAADAAVGALTSTPARVLGLADRFGRLAPGYAADAVLLDHQWNVQAVWADGSALPR